MQCALCVELIDFFHVGTPVLLCFGSLCFCLGCVCLLNQLYVGLLCAMLLFWFFFACVICVSCFVIKVNVHMLFFS